jgi:hypothetical protein
LKSAGCKKYFLGTFLAKGPEGGFEVFPGESAEIIFAIQSDMSGDGFQGQVGGYDKVSSRVKTEKAKIFHGCPAGEFFVFPNEMEFAHVGSFGQMIEGEGFGQVILEIGPDRLNQIILFLIQRKLGNFGEDCPQIGIL